MSDVAILIGIGVAIAIPIYAAIAGYLRAQLYGVEPVDISHITAAALFLFVIALLAGYVPCRRAMRIDPMTALRDE